MDTKRESPRQLGTELLQDLAAKLGKLAQDRLGIRQDAAMAFAEEAAGAIADDWGGQNIYIPMDVVGRRSQRNIQMYREFRGDNAPDLASKYGLSVQCVYRIVKVMRRELGQRQHSLLGPSKP